MSQNRRPASPQHIMEPRDLEYDLKGPNQPKNPMYSTNPPRIPSNQRPNQMQTQNQYPNQSQNPNPNLNANRNIQSSNFANQPRGLHIIPRGNINITGQQRRDVSPRAPPPNGLNARRPLVTGNYPRSPQTNQRKGPPLPPISYQQQQQQQQQQQIRRQEPYNYPIDAPNSPPQDSITSPPMRYQEAPNRPRYPPQRNQNQPSFSMQEDNFDEDIPIERSRQSFSTRGAPRGRGQGQGQGPNQGGRGRSRGNFLGPDAIPINMRGRGGQRRGQGRDFASNQGNTNTNSRYRQDYDRDYEHEYDYSFQQNPQSPAYYPDEDRSNFQKQSSFGRGRSHPREDVIRSNRLSFSPRGRSNYRSRGERSNRGRNRDSDFNNYYSSNQQSSNYQELPSTRIRYNRGDRTRGSRGERGGRGRGERRIGTRRENLRSDTISSNVRGRQQQQFQDQERPRRRGTPLKFITATRRRGNERLQSSQSNQKSRGLGYPTSGAYRRTFNRDNQTSQRRIQREYIKESRRTNLVNQNRNNTNNNDNTTSTQPRYAKVTKSTDEQKQDNNQISVNRNSRWQKKEDTEALHQEEIRKVIESIVRKNKFSNGVEENVLQARLKDYYYKLEARQFRKDAKEQKLNNQIRYRKIDRLNEQQIKNTDENAKKKANEVIEAIRFGYLQNDFELTLSNDGQRIYKLKRKQENGDENDLLISNENDDKLDEMADKLSQFIGDRFLIEDVQRLFSSDPLLDQFVEELNNGVFKDTFEKHDSKGQISFSKVHN